jgi:O-acetyl-ADP-ribose deacetylase (regulator of RNase III)
MSDNIIEASGDLLQADADALVNPVNTVGVMGKGLALQFKQAFPENYAAYAAACRRGEVQPGRMFITDTNTLAGPRCLINFPTKRDWRAKSRMEDISSGLLALVAEVRERGLRSLAIPPLGCGNGGLDWEKVRPLIESAFASLPDVQVLLFPPTHDARNTHHLQDRI